MTNTNITNFRKSLFDYIKQVIEFNDVINVNTKDGNAVIISEEDYNGLMETLYLSSNSKLKRKIIAGKNSKLEECIDEDEVKW